MTYSRSLDSVAAEIWKTYDLLALIADAQSDVKQADEYRRLARDAKRNFAGTIHEMRRFAPLIAAVVGAVAGDEMAQDMTIRLVIKLKQLGNESAKIAEKVEAILKGDRDVERLCKDAGADLSMIIEITLRALKDPSTLHTMFAPDPASQ